MDILLSAGHDKKNTGAYNETYEFSEYDLVQPLTELVSMMLDELGYENKIVPHDKLYDVIQYMKNDGKTTFSVELHFNANAGTPGHGSETLYCLEEAKGYADRFQESMAEQLGSRDRGVKFRNNLGFLKTGDFGIIAEPFFINNDKEIEEFILGDDGTLCTVKIVKLAIYIANAVIYAVS